MRPIWHLFLTEDVRLFDCMGFEAVGGSVDDPVVPLSRTTSHCGEVAKHVAVVTCRTCGERQFNVCDYALELLLDSVKGTPGDPKEPHFRAWCGGLPDVRHEVIAVTRVSFIPVTFVRSKPEPSIEEMLDNMVQHRRLKPLDPSWEESEGDPPF